MLTTRFIFETDPFGSVITCQSVMASSDGEPKVPNILHESTYVPDRTIDTYAIVFPYPVRGDWWIGFRPGEEGLMSEARYVVAFA